MNKYIKYFLGGFICFCIGFVSSLYFLKEKIDLVAERVNLQTSLGSPVRVSNTLGHKIDLPVGTKLLWREKYKETATLELEIVMDISKIKGTEPNRGEHQYYTEQ